MRDATILTLPANLVPFATVDGTDKAGLGTGENKSEDLVFRGAKPNCDVIDGFLESLLKFRVVRDAVGEGVIGPGGGPKGRVRRADRVGIV